jgi:2-methylisocitrate lyase-like PEP mutase family enzyme
VNNLVRLGFEKTDLADGGSDSFVDSIVAWGTLDQVLERVSAHFDAGADHVALQVLVPGRRSVPDTQWRELAPAVVELARKV